MPGELIKIKILYLELTSMDNVIRKLYQWLSNVCDSYLTYLVFTSVQNDTLGLVVSIDSNDSERKVGEIK